MKTPGVYGLIDPRTGQIRYVGASGNLKQREQESRSPHGARRTPRDLFVVELLRLGTQPEFFVIEECATADEAFNHEEWWIAYFRFLGADLLNRSTGGPTTKGVQWGMEDRVRMSRRRGGRPFTDQHGHRYETIKGAARELGLAANKICAVLKGRRNHTGGLRFQYIAECPQ